MVLSNLPKGVIFIIMCLYYTWAIDALDHAHVARRLVHQANWAAVGTISTSSKIQGFPMVNVISISDDKMAGRSSGHIQFLLTDLDFTGSDWHQNNKVTFLFSDDQLLNCKNHKPNAIDPMEPTCARAIISGKIKKVELLR